MNKPTSLLDESWSLCMFLNTCIKLNLLSNGKDYFKEFKEGVYDHYRMVYQIPPEDLDRMVKEALDGQNQRILSKANLELAKCRPLQAQFSLGDERIINGLAQVGDLDVLMEMVYEE